MEKKIKGRPPRLAQIFHRTYSPLYFVTFCTRDRQMILAQEIVQSAFCIYAQRGVDEHGVAVGRFVLMPDHVHLFVRGGPDFVLSQWVHGLKYALSRALKDRLSSPVWQPGFFDHLLRNSESYFEKWQYVRQNPVRAGLVQSPEEWPYQGEIVLIEGV